MSLWFELVASGLITGGIYAVVAIGLNLQYGLMRILNISHGEFLMLGAYLTWLAHTVLQVNPLVFLPAVALLLFVAGVAVYRLCFHRIVSTAPAVEVIEARSLLVGFGLLYLVQNAAYLVWGADLRGYSFLVEPIENRQILAHGSGQNHDVGFSEHDRIVCCDVDGVQPHRRLEDVLVVDADHERRRPDLTGCQGD